MTDHTKIPVWPKIHARITDDQHGTVSVNGLDHPVRAEDITGIRRAIISHVTSVAHKVGRPVKMDSTDPDGSFWYLVVHPDGTVEEDESALTPPPKKPGRGGSKRKKPEPGPLAHETAGEQSDPRGLPVEEQEQVLDRIYYPVIPGAQVPKPSPQSPEPESAQREPGPETHDDPPTDPRPVGGIEYSASQWENAINEHNWDQGASGVVRLLRNAGMDRPPMLSAETSTTPGPSPEERPASSLPQR